MYQTRPDGVRRCTDKVQTNKELVMKARKRAPGGGRKPKGRISGKSATLSTRITPGIRQALESERGGQQSISQFAEEMIELGLIEKRRRDRPDSIRGFCHIIAKLATETCAFKGADGKPAFDWLTNPFMFQTFKLSIQKFMDGITPAGEMRAPAEDEPILANSTVWGPHNTPEERADHVATAISRELHRALPVAAAKLTADQLWPAPKSEGPGFKAGRRTKRGALVPPEISVPQWPREMEAELMREQIAMSQAKAALILKGQ
jgi:hypothetical protein